MKRVLLLTNKLPHYRKPLYEKLGSNYELSIAHCGSPTISSKYKEIILDEKRIGPFFLYKEVPEYTEFDVVIIYLNPRLLNLYFSIFAFRKKTKFILYGIGVSGSYTKRYDEGRVMSILTRALVNKSDAAVFYDDYPSIKYAGRGISRYKMFTAYNTVEVINPKVSKVDIRDMFLFIGSLYEAKGIDILLEAYKLAKIKNKKIKPLVIIGDGPLKLSIEEFIEENELSNQIFVKGSITDDSVLSEYFSRTICTLSPDQAGLSVQKSFAFGVPFLTSKYPISGGEFTSIIDGITGYFYDGTPENLMQKLIDVANDPNAQQIADNCKFYYDQFRSPDNWLHGFKSAIEYVLEK